MSEPRTIVEVLRYRAEHTPDRLHARYLFPDRNPEEQSYADLERRARQFAAALEAMDTPRGSVVQIVMPHHRDMLPAFYGAMWMGAIPCFLPFPTGRMHPERYFNDLQALIERARPHAVITDGTLAGELQPLLAGVPHAPAILLHEQVAADAPLAGDPAPCEHEDIALIQCSSGSTGLQKGVMLSNRAILNECKGLADFFEMTADDVFVCWMPLYHDWGLVCNAIHPLVLGAPTTLMSALHWVGRPATVLEVITKLKATIYYQPNFAFNFMARRVSDEELGGIDLSSLRLCSNGAEPCWHESHEMFAERFESVGFRREMLGIVYGMAEVVCVVIGAGNKEPIRVDVVDRRRLQQDHKAVPVDADDPDARRLLGVGRCFPGSTFKVMDAEGRNVPDRQVGEIAIKSHALFHGYHNNEEISRERVRDGWYITKDLGYIAEGILYVTGRKTDLIIIGGDNIYPQDIEQMATEHPAVVPGRVIAIGVDDHDLGTQKLIIIAETRSDDRKVHEDVKRFIRREVTGRLNVQPDKIYIAPHMWLYKTSSGKVARLPNLRRLAELETQTTRSVDS